MNQFCFRFFIFLSTSKSTNMFYESEMIKELQSRKIFSIDNNIIKTTLNPTKFNKKHLTDVINLQQTINKLLLLSNKQSNCQDPMFKILKHIICNKKKNEIEVMFVRTDYLLEDTMKLVEINTVSCAFPIYGTMVNEIHKKNSNAYVSESKDKFIELIVKTKEVFCEKYKVNNPIAILVSHDKKNKNEKIFIQNLLSKKNIELLILNYQDMQKYGKILKDFFYYNGNLVFLIYYRWFYNADQYLQSDIDFRLKLENTKTISLPSAEIQLIGHKHFQLIFNNEMFLKEYCTEEETKILLTHFTDYKSKDEKGFDKNEYLVKRYGEGGNNVFISVEDAHSSFQKIKISDPTFETLGTFSYTNENVGLYDPQSVLKIEDLNNPLFKNEFEFFFMKKINSPPFVNQFINENDICEVIPEIGIFGGLICVDSKIILNEYMGYLCRTKKKGDLECGVSGGFGGLDSLELVDE